MNRRNFLQGVVAGIVASQMPVRSLAAMPGNVVITGTLTGTPLTINVSEGLLVINRDARTIGFTKTAEHSGVTLRDVYHTLKDTWKRDIGGLLPEPFPMEAITPEFAKMQNDWSMDMSRPNALRVGCIEELDSVKWAAFVGLGTWEPDGLILSRDGRQAVEDVNPDHHIVRLTPGMKRLKWQAISLDPQYVEVVRHPYESNWNQMRCLSSNDPSTFETTGLGIDDVYAQTQGSIRFPIPHLPARPSEVRRDVRNRINDNMVRRRSQESGV